MATSVLENPTTMSTFYTDSNLYHVITNVIARTITAYETDTGAELDLVLGASSNLKVEAVSGINMYVKDTGAGVNLFATTVAGGVRTDELVWSMTGSNSNTYITAQGTNQLIIAGSDPLKTVTAGGTTFTTASNTQYVSTPSSMFVFNKGMQVPELAPLSNLIATDGVFGEDISLWQRTGRSNVGDVSEIGYAFRLNSNQQMEVLQYGKVIMPQGQAAKTVMQRVGVFSSVAAFNSNMSSDPTIGSFDPFAVLDEIYETFPDTLPPV